MEDAYRGSGLPAADPGHGRLDVRPLVIGLAAVAALMMIPGLALWNAHTYFRGDGLVWMAIGEAGRALYIGREGNVYTWYSAMLLAAVAAGLALHALTARAAGRSGLRYAVLAVVALILSADEGAALHEKLGSAARFLGVNPSWTFDWLFIGISMAVVGGAFLLWVSRGIDPVLRRRLILAGAVFLLGALVFEALSGLAGKALGGPREPVAIVAYQGIQFVEESLEIAGALIALWAVLDGLGPRLIEGRVAIQASGAPSNRAA
jgi:hypothetical protein